MKQPTKDTLRDQLALAADRIMELEADNAALREGPVWRWVMEIPDCKPWWRRALTPQQHAARQRGGWEAHSAAAQVLARMQAPRKWWHRLWHKCKAVLGRG